jgi:NAD-dependent dihydropyrimidine dehydrogenase PreA subunit
MLLSKMDDLVYGLLIMKLAVVDSIYEFTNITVGLGLYDAHRVYESVFVAVCRSYCLGLEIITPVVDVPPGPLVHANPDKIRNTQKGQPVVLCQYPLCVTLTDTVSFQMVHYMFEVDQAVIGKFGIERIMYTEYNIINVYREAENHTNTHNVIFNYEAYCKSMQYSASKSNGYISELLSNIRRTPSIFITTNSREYWHINHRQTIGVYCKKCFTVLIKQEIEHTCRLCGDTCETTLIIKNDWGVKRRSILLWNVHLDMWLTLFFGPDCTLAELEKASSTFMYAADLSDPSAPVGVILRDDMSSSYVGPRRYTKWNLIEAGISDEYGKIRI